MKRPSLSFIRLLEACFAGRLEARKHMPYFWMQERGSLDDIFTVTDADVRFPRKMNSA